MGLAKNKQEKSNNIKLLITLLGTMAASAGGSGLSGDCGIIIINIMAWQHGQRMQPPTCRYYCKVDSTLLDLELTKSHNIKLLITY